MLSFSISSSPVYILRPVDRVTRFDDWCVLLVRMRAVGGARVTVEPKEQATETNVFRETFDVFYAREFRAVVGLAYVLSGSRSGAEDLAQEAFLAALRHWHRIAGYDDPGAWVRRVVAHRAVSRFRRRAAEARALLRLGEREYVVADLDEPAGAVWDAVRRLPARQAQVVALRFFDGRSIANIARILDCSENTVKTHLRRGKQTLARRLGEEES